MVIHHVHPSKQSPCGPCRLIVLLVSLLLAAAANRVNANNSVTQPPSPVLLCLYRFEEEPTLGPYYYDVQDSTSLTEGSLDVDPNVDGPLPTRTAGFRGGSGWDFSSSDLAVRVRPTESLFQFGTNDNDDLLGLSSSVGSSVGLVLGGSVDLNEEMEAVGGATVAFAMQKKSGLSDSFDRVVFGPGVDVYELKDGITVCVQDACGNAHNLPLSDKQWHSFVIVIESWAVGGTVNVYGDGSLVATFQTAAPRRVVSAKKEMWMLGSRFDQMPGDYKGQLDEFCLFRHAFAQEDVDLYHSQGGLPFLSKQVFQPLPRSYFIPPYQHPRIFMTPSDLPSWRERVASNNNGVTSMARDRMESSLNATLRDYSSPIGQMYQRYLNCENNDFSSYTYESLSIDGEILRAALIAVFDDDVEMQTQLATALACLANVLYLVHKPTSWMLDHNHNHNTALAYDFLYNAMTDEQRGKVRQFISKMTKYRQSYGSLEPVHNAATNWVTHHDDVVLSSLAIEGEEGYDPVVYDLHVKKQRKFLKNGGIFESGFTHEGLTYFEMGMEKAAPSILASEIRGANLLSTTFAKNAMRAAFYQLTPWTKNYGTQVHSFSDGSVPWLGRGGTYYFSLIMIHFFPDDPMIALFYRMLVQAFKDRKRDPEYYWFIFGVSDDFSVLDKDYSFQEVANKMGLDRSLFCPDSGHSVFRSDWSENAMSVHFSSRMDTWYLGHIHSDGNSFALFSHKKSWIMDTGYHDTYNDYHSTILIDGVGQAGSSMKPSWPSMPNKFIDFTDDDGDFAGAVGDASFAYTYYKDNMACHSKNQASCDSSNLCAWDANDEFGGSCNRFWVLDKYPLHSKFSMGPSFRTFANFTYPKLFNGEPRDPDSFYEAFKKTTEVSSWGGMFNPVKFAFRTMIVVRGAFPYVLIVDDIQASDELEHEYTLVFNMGYSYNKNSDVEETVVLNYTSPTEALVQFEYYEAGDPQLLVRMIEAGNSPDLQDDPQVELIQIQKGSTNGLPRRGDKQLRLRRNTVIPRFKTILYPHEPTSPEMITTYDKELGILEVVVGTQVDRFVFDSSDSDGRTRYSGTRIGHAPTKSPSSTFAPTFSPKICVSYYEGSNSWDSLPDAGLKSLTPYKTSFVANINFKNRHGDFADSGRYRYLAALFEGGLDFPSDGYYNLCITSNDGSKLFLDGTLKINNDFMGSADRTECNNVNVSSGVHEVMIEYWESDGDATMIFKWQTPGSSELSVVPKESWIYMAPSTPAPSPLQARLSLLALYRFEQDPSSGVVNDSTGQSQGILIPQSNSDLPLWVNGHTGKAIDFHHSTMAVLIEATEPLQSFGATSSSSIAFAYKVGNNVSFNRILMGPSIEMYQFKEGISLNIYGESFTFYPPNLNDGGWHTIMIVIEEWGQVPDKLKVYTDGNLLISRTSPASDPSASESNPWLLGRRYTNTDYRSFEGYLDEFCIFDGALSASDATSFHQYGGQYFLLTTHTPSPVALTPLPVAFTPSPVLSTPAPVALTPVPVTSTTAPIVSTPAPVTSTPAPLASTVAPVANPKPCADRTDTWTIDGREQNWCSFAANKTAKRCKNFDLYIDCPVTCKICSSTPAPVALTTISPTTSSGGGGGPTCCGGELDYVKTQVENLTVEMNQMKNQIAEILNILQTSSTSAPAASTPAPVASPTPCADKIGRWSLEEGGENKNWCSFAANKTAKRCKQFDLYIDVTDKIVAWKKYKLTKCRKTFSWFTLSIPIHLVLQKS